MTDSTLDSDPWVGRELAGQFKVVRRLSGGGMGSVYLAEQTDVGRRVVLKFLLPQLASDPVSLERFRREARSVARLNHPNIVQVHRFGESADVHFLAMEYVDGMDLAHLLLERTKVPVMTAFHIAEQVLSALHEAHAAGIIHRDLKPSNIMVTTLSGDPFFVKVLDFGLAKTVEGSQVDVSLTQAGRVVGTPAFMSPEQVTGNSLDGRSDLYSFGLILYHMLTGRHPFVARTPSEFMLKHTSESVGLPSARFPELRIPDDAEKSLMRMLARFPEDRYSSCAEALHEVQQVIRRLRNGPASDVASVPKVYPDKFALLPQGSTFATAPTAIADSPAGAAEHLVQGSRFPRRILVRVAGVAAILAALIGIGMVFLPSPDKQPTKPTGVDKRAPLPVPAAGKGSVGASPAAVRSPSTTPGGSPVSNPGQENHDGVRPSDQIDQPPKANSDATGEPSAARPLVATKGVEGATQPALPPSATDGTPPGLLSALPQKPGLITPPDAPLPGTGPMPSNLPKVEEILPELDKPVGSELLTASPTTLSFSVPLNLEKTLQYYEEWFKKRNIPTRKDASGVFSLDPKSNIAVVYATEKTETTTSIYVVARVPVLSGKPATEPTAFGEAVYPGMVIGAMAPQAILYNVPESADKVISFYDKKYCVLQNITCMRSSAGNIAYLSVTTGASDLKFASLIVQTEPSSGGTVILVANRFAIGNGSPK